ncbi:hypothetical protein AB1Y20_023231 [Prymnesium parvum]|uniref:Uncharacterized protein n=1 Tax=Prymnesium parvum TaxID=97485 RepID=A0AB34JG61_PRYPA
MSSSDDAKSDTVRIIDIFSYGGKHYDRTLRLRLHEMASIPNLLHVLLEMGTPLSRNLQFAAVVEQGHFDLRDLAWAPFRQRIQHVKLNGSQLFASLVPCTGTGRACEPTHPNAHLAQHIMRTVGFSTALSMVWPPAASNDWVLLSDIDEIPRAHLFVNSLLADSSVRFQLENGRVFALAGPCFYYSVECMASPLSWESQWSLGPRLATAATLRNSSWNAIRSGKGIVATVIRDASWHFGYLMTHSEILTKLCFNTDPAVRKLCRAPDALSVIKQSVAECRDLFGLEYNLLPDLLMSGVLCHNVRDLFLEWHTGKNTLSWQEEQLPLPDVDLRRAFTWMLKRAKSRCQLRLHDWI